MSSCCKNAATEKKTHHRIRSAPPYIPTSALFRHQTAASKKRTLGSRGQSRQQKSRQDNYQHGYAKSTSPTLKKQTLVSTSIVRTPGYTLTRTPTNVRMDINTSTFFGGKNELQVDGQHSLAKSSNLSLSSSSKLKRDSPSSSIVLRVAMLDQVVQEKKDLELQIAELHIQIQIMQQDYAEKENEKEALFLEAKKELNAQHQVEIRELEEKHDQENGDIQNYHNILIQTITKEHEEKKDEYEKRLTAVNEELQESFVEKERALKHLKEELRDVHSVATQRLTHELMENAHRQLEDTEAKLRQEHRQELDELSASHKAEIGSIMEKFDEAMALKDQLQKSIKKNKKLEKEISKQKEKYQAVKEQQTKTEGLLQESRKKFDDLKDNFQEKVWEVERNYRDKIDSLKAENTLLRRRLLQKTDQFSDYRANTEQLQAAKIRSTKEKVQIVLRARQRASLSIAMGTSDVDMPPPQLHSRPTSAPSTRSERKSAKLKTST